jgi:hypothetical protein
MKKRTMTAEQKLVRTRSRVRTLERANRELKRKLWDLEDTRTNDFAQMKGFTGILKGMLSADKLETLWDRFHELCEREGWETLETEDPRIAAVLDAATKAAGC